MKAHSNCNITNIKHDNMEVLIYLKSVCSEVYLTDPERPRGTWHSLKMCSLAHHRTSRRFAPCCLGTCQNIQLPFPSRVFSRFLSFFVSVESFYPLTHKWNEEREKRGMEKGSKKGEKAWVPWDGIQSDSRKKTREVICTLLLSVMRRAGSHVVTGWLGLLYRVTTRIT